MRLRSQYFICILALMTGIGSAQTSLVSTGTPPFGSFGGGPFDTVNLGNLNVHFAIPVLHKAGRGTPFTYDLSYDSSIWIPVTSSGTTQWQPVLNWGWRGQTEARTGYVSHSMTGPTTICNGTGVLVTFSNWAYHDVFGVVHPFAGQTDTHEGKCGNGSSSLTATSTDGSGYTLSATGGGVNSVTSRGGSVWKPPVGATNGSGLVTDHNGNQETVNASGQFFDTLSSTAPVLTVAGSGTASSPLTFTYTAPSNATAAYTVNYTQYTVQTAFGVPSVSEYGPLANPLVSSIQLPDGSKYTFTYEAGPSSCVLQSGTTSCITGRIKTVTLPTGGTMTYTYSGGAHGIESDGSTAILTRTLSATTTAPAQNRSYSRALQTGSKAVGPGSTWTTTVVDPSGNNTVINFAEDSATGTSATYNFYETQRQVYQGGISTNSCSGSTINNCLLATTTRCYNANYTTCSTATVGSPITQTDFYSGQLPNGSNPRLSQVLYNGFGLVTDEKEYDYGATTGGAPGTSHLVREGATTYASLGNGIVNKPATIVVSDWTSGNAVTLASTSFSYDQTTPTPTSGTPQQVAITGSRGNLTTVTASTSATASLSKAFTYFDTGTPNVITDANGTTTMYAYSTTTQGPTTASCGNSYPTGITISATGVNLSTSTTWNCTGGVATQTTDPNGNIVTSNYTDDDFWRPASVLDQISNQVNITYSGQTSAETTMQNFNSGNSASDSRTTVDGFGRPIFSQRKQGPSATTYDTGETDYNNLGQPSRSTMPYSAAASPTSSNTTAPATTTTYDALGRALTIKDADGGTVANTYTNNDVSQKVSGTQTFQKQFEYDGLGRLTSVCEISSTLPGVGTCGQSTKQTGYWTVYTYDALGHLLTVTQNAQAASTSQQTRAFVYDMLGRITSRVQSGNRECRQERHCDLHLRFGCVVWRGSHYVEGRSGPKDG